MNHVKIIGTGRYLPEKVLTNIELEQFVETSDDWIFSRTGIKQRYIAINEGDYQLAAKAGKNAMESAGLKPEDIDLIIIATISGENAFPSTACLVQKELGAVNAMAFDISAACAGFIFALQTAHQFLRNGVFKHALVIGSEKLSQILNWEDRTTCVLFGDGAGAIALGVSESEGILDSVCRSKGEGYECLTSGLSQMKTPFYDAVVAEGLKMEGRAVFEFACTTVPKVIEEVLEKVGLGKDDVDTYILHQANQRIINTVAKRLGQDIGKFYSNIEFYGNTSSASIAIALDELYKAGTLTGQKVVLAGFGAGLTYGATVIQF